MGHLTHARLKNAKPTIKPYRLSDGHGLYLLVEPDGKKRWRYRYEIAQKENVFALGDYPKVGLSAARKARAEARELVKRGIHPAQQARTERLRRQSDSGNTFQAVAQDWIAQRKARWTPGYKAQVETYLAREVYPQIGALPIKDVTAAHFLGVLKRIEKRGALSVAGLVRQWVGAIFRYGIATLRCENDPSVALRGAIPQAQRQHHKPLPLSEIPEFKRRLSAYGGRPETIVAMRLLLIVWVRPGELRRARWGEFDLQEALWRIPAERMKMRRPHIVPLPKQAVALLQELQTYSGRLPYLFPNMRRPTTCMSLTTLNRALERMSYGGRFSGHGFRATAATALAEMGWPRDVIERQLAHAERSKTVAAYHQSEFLTERRNMLQQWADTIDAAGAQVIPIGRSA